MVAIMCVFYSCIDEIELNIDTEVRSIVIDGLVTDRQNDFDLKISQSSVIGVGNDNILDPVLGATAQLQDNMGNSFPYVELEDGVYRLRDFEASRGIMYNIDITLPDGRHYQSRPAALRSSSSIDTITYAVEEETYRNNAGEIITEQVFQVKIATDVADSPQAPFLRWRIEGEYQLQESYPGALNPRRCYIKNNLDLNDLRVFDTSNLEGTNLFDQIIAETTFDFRFGEQYCLHISQYSLSEDEFEYWSNTKEIIDIEGGLFDPPPGTIRGNMFNVDDPSDVVVGYFSVSSEYFVRQFVNSNEIGVFVRPKCTGFRFNIPFGCDDCLMITGSTLARPSYWEF